MSCRRARGFESKRTNEPPTECRGCEVQPRLALALRGLSWFIPTSHTQHATCHGSSTAPSPTTRGASEPRFRVRRFGPLSQPSGPKPGMGQVRPGGCPCASACALASLDAKPPAPFPTAPNPLSSGLSGLSCSYGVCAAAEDRRLAWESRVTRERRGHRTPDLRSLRSPPVTQIWGLLS